jgi:hypothetical protein
LDAATNGRGLYAMLMDARSVIRRSLASPRRRKPETIISHPSERPDERVAMHMIGRIVAGLDYRPSPGLGHPKSGR